jgi:hypothetical protein
VTLRCWECKTCGWEHWCRSGSRPQAVCPDPKCAKQNPTWIGHTHGARSSCELAELTPSLEALKPGDPVDVLTSYGWTAARFVGWVADGLAAAIEGVDQQGERIRSVGRGNLRARVVDV